MRRVEVLNVVAVFRHWRATVSSPAVRGRIGWQRGCKRGRGLRFRSLPYFFPYFQKFLYFFPYFQEFPLSYPQFKKIE